MSSRTGHRLQYGACVLHAGYLDTHSEYIILIDFPLQQWLHEYALMLSYTYIAYLVYDLFRFSGKKGEKIYFYQM
jgi:hypothetical protein